MNAGTAKRAEARYDLANRQADYPIWEAEQPLRTYLLCSHMRSGSTLLGEAMYCAGGMGCPIEYFHVGFQPGLSEMWGATDQASYLRAVYRYRTDPSGSLGIKLFWMDAIGLCLNYCPDEAATLNADLETLPEAAPRVYEMGRKVFKELFPHPQFIFLTRRDRLRQAISSMISGQVQVWRNIPGIDDRAPAQIPTYDYGVILDRLSYAVYSEFRWKEFFQSVGVSPYTITYEDLATDYAGTIKNFLVVMGRWRPEVEIHAPRLQRQANRLSEEFAWRFLEEHAKKRKDAGSRQAASRELEAVMEMTC